MNKTIFYVAVLLLLIAAGCTTIGSSSVLIDKDGKFPSQFCEERGFKDRVIMLESKYCPACQQTLPVFIDAAAEVGVEPLILDLSEPDQLEQMKDMGIEIQYTPTFIFGCNYYVGASDRETYVQRLSALD